ncbi:MAG: Sigma-70 region 2 [Chloroflexi bacterium]|jgi:RNA polymerase sigma-70 factor (ECF subfamily)|nr:Sigma-70 region 2 [Chloroflexota bacterium]
MYGTTATWTEDSGRGPERHVAVSAAQVVETERGSLLGWVTAMTRDRDVAEDVVQEALVRLWLEMEAGRCPDNPAAWLRRVSSNLVASQARHAAVVRRYEDVEVSRPHDPVPSVEAEAQGHEMAAALGVALATLPRRDGEAIAMAAAGISRATMAVRLSRSEPATRTLLCRARERLRMAFEAELGGSAA